MPTIGERIKEERERLGLSQLALAELCGVTMRSQRNYEKDERSPDAQYLALLLGEGVDVLYVLTGARSGEASATAQLAKDEEILLDNYRNSPPEAQAAIKATSSAFASSKKRHRKAA